MSRCTRSSLILLTGAGLVSGFICVAVPGTAAEWRLGAIFGLALVAYFALVERYRTPFRFFAQVCACSAAYPTSMVGTFFIWKLLRQVMNIEKSHSSHIPLFFVFIGGCIGGCFTLFSAMLLFGPAPMSRRVAGATLVCAVLLGAAGVVGGEIDLQRGVELSRPEAQLIVWQTGACLLLGLLLRRARNLPGARQLHPGISR